MEICTVGGFEEVGKNMTAVKVEEDVFIFDIGLHIPGIVELQEENITEFRSLTCLTAFSLPPLFYQLA